MTMGNKEMNTRLEGLERVTYQPGEIIFQEGDEGCCAYLIETGTVAITSQSGKQCLEISTLGNGDLFGEVALLDNKPRTATATARERACLVRINRDLIQTTLASSGPIIEHLLRLILSRFRDTHARLTGNRRIPSTAVAKETDPALSTTQQNLIAHIQIATDLKTALLQEEFQLYYQPILRIKDQQLAGFEALIRWAHPEKGTLPPAEFLRVAESTNQIVPIGNWILKQACTDIKALLDSTTKMPAHQTLFVSINVSARQLGRATDADHIKHILAAESVTTQSVKLEITETLMMDDPEHAGRILSDLKQAGFQISLDDFGTGYSSLSYLQKFPVDTIKIDRSFVNRMFADTSSLQIVKASIELAGAMGLEVIAEGVENQEEAELLSRLNCAYAQGYYYSRPLPFDEAINYIKQIQYGSRAVSLAN